MTIRWITEQLGTSPWKEELVTAPFDVVDVRLLRDAAGNSPALIQEKIAEAQNHLKDGRGVVICCDYGISRSNAIAAGVLARVEGIGLDEALERVIRATGETGIKIDFVQDVRRALGMEQSSTAAPKALILGLDSFVGRAVNALLEIGQGDEAIEQNRALVWNPVLLDAAMQRSGSNRLLFCWHPPGMDTNLAAGQLVTGLRNALEVCRVRKAGLVFLSGQQVFAGHKVAGQVSFGEADTPQPAGAAGDGLFLGEALIKQYAARYDMPTLIVRPPRVYGPGDERPWVLNTMVRKALAGEDITTHRYRNGFPVIELLHVIDLASALSSALETDLTGVLHVSAANSISTHDLAETVMRIAKSSSRLVTAEIPGDFRSVQLVSQIAHAIPEWTPTVRLEAGLAGLVASISQDSLKDKT